MSKEEKKTPKSIVEEVLSVARARSLWTANYFPALPFTPQHFEVGSLLPAMLYMARWGQRRGKGNFVETFARRDSNNKAIAPTLADVGNGLLNKGHGVFDGFAHTVGQEMLADLLLTYCLENKGHELGHDQQVQRVFPTHYLASWLDLPSSATDLRGVPELLTTLLCWQEKGEFLKPGGEGRFPVGRNFDDNPLLALFARHMAIRGPYASDLSSDGFIENLADDLGIDELLAVRLAQACGGAPLKVKGKDETSNIPNRWPVADVAAKHLRRDLATFIDVYGHALPRQAFLPMLEAGIGVGMTSLLFSTAATVMEWEKSGVVPDNQMSLPLFVDCSHGQDSRLRNVSEAAKYLDIERTYLHRKIQEHGIAKNECF